MVQAKRTLLSIVVSLTCTASLCASWITVSVLTSCNGRGQANKKNPDSLLIHLPAASTVPAAEMLLYKKACENWYDTVLKNRGFNGAILVAKKGNIVFEAYNGTGHIDKKDTITAVTPFHIASVSKTFTAMAVLKLWQDGKLSLDDEFSKYFSAFNYPGVTIRTLLNHRSGLPNYVYFMETLGWNKKKYIRNEDVLAWLINRKAELKNIAQPNTRFTYCNTNYALLALLIEKLSGEKMPAYLQQTFFTPLQMSHTFVFDTSMLSAVNPSYDWRGQVMPFNFLDAVYGDKNIYTTVQDLSIWDKALTSGKIFTERTLEEAYAPYSNEKPGIRNYGLGWRMNIYSNGKKMIYHNGWWHGNNASFIRLIQDSATIIVMGNKFNRGVYHAKDMAMVFGDYGSGMEEEEEALPNVKKSDSVNRSAPNPDNVSKKVARRQAAKVKNKKRRT